MKSILDVKPTWKRIASHFILEKLHDHPLPWRIEQDWTSEVTAADGTTIVKCMTPQEAEWVIKLAEKITKDLAESDAEINALIEQT